jgi:predicted GNAT superfamily acetyltransferase
MSVKKGYKKVIKVEGKTFVIREPHNPEEHRELMEIERDIWSTDYREVFPYHITIPLIDIGGVVLGAFDSSTGKAVGVAVAMPGILDDELIYYSHMVGVIKDVRYKGLGYHLKMAQRDYALARDIKRILWTFDPLLSLNAWFNIAKLGVICRTYRVNYYGLMNVEYNKGIESDRLKAEWYVNSIRVNKRLSGNLPVKGVDYFLDRGGTVVLRTHYIKGELQAPDNPNLESASDIILVEIPSDFLSIQQRDMQLAMDWRLKLREVLIHYLSKDYVIFEFTRSDDKTRSYYVLWRNELKDILGGAYP